MRPKKGNMATRVESIDGFVQQVRKRLNRHLGLDILIRGLGVTGMVLLLVGLLYLAGGRRIPWFWYLLVPGVALLGGMVWWVICRRSFDAAAAYADRHFQLKDAVRSYGGFSRANQCEGIYELQAEHTRAALEKVQAADVKYRWPWRTIGCCMALLLFSALLALKADSPRTTETQHRAGQVLAETEQINESIKEALEQIKEDAKKENIEELVALERLEKAVDDLRETPDLKDALRQYAQLERQLNTALSKLQQRQEEQLYQKMGEALQQSDQAKALGQHLAAQQYKTAAQELKQYEIDKAASPEDRAKQLERLKAVSQRMAEAAERGRSACKAADLAQRLDKAVGAARKGTNSSGNNSASQRSTSSPGSSPSSPSSSSQGSSSPGSGSKASGSQGSGSQGSAASGGGSEGDSQGDSADGANECLGEMSGSLNDLDAKRKAESMIQAFCKTLSQCQGKLSDSSGSGNGDGGNGGKGSGDGSGNGGLEPGTGSSSNTNANINNTRSTGDKSVLKGIKRQGSSVSMTEAATEGSGTSSGVNTRLVQQYRHQAESFVRREDVSETVKSGVKEYFERIHRTEEGN
jgi:hypothetical protein